MNGAAAEPTLIDELEVDACAGRERWVASSEEDWPHEERQLVDQPGDERLCYEVRAANEKIARGGDLQVLDSAHIEVAFEPGLHRERRG